MSHFAVAVFSYKRLNEDELFKVMLPFIESYQELDGGAQEMCDVLGYRVPDGILPEEVLVDHNILEFVEDNIEDEYLNGIVSRYVKLPLDKYTSRRKNYSPYDDRFLVKCDEEHAQRIRYDGDTPTYYCYDYTGYTMIDVPQYKIYKTIEEYQKEMYGYLHYNYKYQTWGYYRTLQSMWDWYQIGGRWEGLLPVDVATAQDPIKVPIYKEEDVRCLSIFKDHKPIGYAEDRANGAYIRDLNLEKAKASIRERMSKIQHDIDTRPVDKDSEAYKQWMANTSYFFNSPEDIYEDLKHKLETDLPFHIYAIITHEGEWIAAGTMGWWACSDDTPESRRSYNEELKQYLIDNPNKYVTIVDCHI